MTPRPLVVVTGPNRGIGFEIARGVAERGYRVVAVARTEERAERAALRIRGTVENADVVPFGADLSSLAAVRGVASDILTQFDRVDGLVLNAATTPARRRVTGDGLEAQFQVNHLAGFLLQRLLDERLRHTAQRTGTARVVIVASEAHRRGHLDFDDLMFERRRYRRLAAYDATKLANVLHMRGLARRLEGTDVLVNAAHPGVVSTGLLGGFFGPLYPVRFLFRSARGGAAPIVHLATDPSVSGVSGRYFKRFKPVAASTGSTDEAATERLWRLSEALVGLSSPA